MTTLNIESRLAPVLPTGGTTTTRRAEGRRIAVLVAGEETGGRFALVESVEVRGAEPPRHRHHREDETLYVLAGNLRVWVGDGWTDVPAGAAGVLPRGVEHADAVATPEARVLTALVPAGF